MATITDPIGIELYQWLNGSQILTVSSCGAKAAVYDLATQEAGVIIDLKPSPKCLRVSGGLIGAVQKSKDGRDFFELFNQRPLFSVVRFFLEPKNTTKFYFGFQNLFIFLIDKSASKNLFVYSVRGERVADLLFENPVYKLKLSTDAKVMIVADTNSSLYQVDGTNFGFKMLQKLPEILDTAAEGFFYEQIRKPFDANFSEKEFFGTAKKIFEISGKFSPKKIGFSVEKTGIKKMKLNSTGTSLLFTLGRFISEFGKISFFGGFGFV